MPLTNQQRRQRLVDLLVQLSREQRGTSAYYGNLKAVPGGLDFRRLISNVGFPSETLITYVTPTDASVHIGNEPREVNSITFHPYGVELDNARFTSTQQVDQRFHNAPLSTGDGLTNFPNDPNFLMPGYCNLATTSNEKDVTFVIDSTTPQRSKSWHFYVNRVGDLIVGAAIDDIVCVDGATSTSVNIAYEALLVRSKTNTTLIEAPMTDVQLQTLGILCAKIETVFQQLPESVGTPGFNRVTINGFQNTNFVSNLPSDLPFNYTESTFDSFFELVDNLPNFDLSTDVFRPASEVDQLDQREIVRTAISDNDTLGTRSTILANYADRAGASRAQEMQDRPRISYFLRRSEVAAQTASTLSQQATAVSDSDAGEQSNPAVATNTDGFVYNFRTGKWLDNNPV